MNRIVRITMLMITVAALAVAVIGAYHHVPAEEDHISIARAPIAAPAFNGPPSAFTTTTKHALVGTYINQGEFTLINGAPLSITANTYTPIDTATTITCPGTTGSCLIVSEQWTQLSLGGISGGQAATCLYVDGSPDVYCGNFDGEMFAGFSNATTSIRRPCPMARTRCKRMSSRPPTHWRIT